MNDPRTVIERYTTAATTLDIEGILSLYAGNMRMFDLMLPWQIRGKEDWRSGVEHWFASTGDAPQAVASDIEVHQTSEMALITLLMEYSHLENGTRFSMTNRLTWVLLPHGSDWQILHEHTSAPLDEHNGMGAVWQP